MGKNLSTNFPKKQPLDLSRHWWFGDPIQNPTGKTESFTALAFGFGAMILFGKFFLVLLRDANPFKEQTVEVYGNARCEQTQD